VTGWGTPAECVVNISEGRDPLVVTTIGDAAGALLLDVHSDPEHNRSVLTLGGPLSEVEAAVRDVAVATVAAIDLRSHRGVHPRLGALDVVPFVTLPSGTAPADLADAVAARDRFARWAGAALDLPCFLYGPERSLPEVRANAFGSLSPDTGPAEAHVTAGASAVGARPPLIAYNVWISCTEDDGDGSAALAVARSLAAALRGPAVRSLGLPVAAGAQVSLNLIDPARAAIAAHYDTVAEGARRHGCSVIRAELVGLLPDAALRAVPRSRWRELDLDEERTIEARMADHGFPVAPAEPGPG
jgi:glutamate formiminotransferase / 5-formyltetrahydrofolate cyclo-ligase